jgi:hypothetical protein
MYCGRCAGAEVLAFSLRAVGGHLNSYRYCSTHLYTDTPYGTDERGSTD